MVDIRQLVSEHKELVINTRRDLHRIPETAYTEKKTSAYVAEYLNREGLEVQTGIATYGVVALLKTGRPGPTLLLRADMDALRLHAKGILDCDPAKQGEVIAGLQVQNPECLSHGFDQKPYIVITTQFFNEVIQQLDDWGYAAMTDYCVTVSF